MCTNPLNAYILDWQAYCDSFKYVMSAKYISCRFVQLMLSSYYQRKLIWNISAIPKQYHFLLRQVEVPCGKCDDCLLKRAASWSLRCQHEAMYHNDMCFLTLTYDTDHLPRNNGVPTVFYPDIQIFMKRLRANLHYMYGDKAPKIRYFVCTEYGGKTFRPHFHVILYGFCPEDAFNRKFVWKRGKSGMLVYRSNFFEEIWNRGMVFLGSVTKFACGYVARYTLEKSKHRHSKEFYKDRFHEKIGMSRREGLGIQWIKEHYKEVLTQGYIRDLERLQVKHSIPRAYSNYIQSYDSHFYWKVYHPIKQSNYEKFINLIKVHYKTAQDFVNKCKHQIQYNANLIKTKLQRTLTEIDFNEFETLPTILRC